MSCSCSLTSSLVSAGGDVRCEVAPAAQRRSRKMDSARFAGSEVQAWRALLGCNGAGGAQRAELHLGETWQRCCRDAAVPAPPPHGYHFVPHCSDISDSFTCFPPRFSLQAMTKPCPDSFWHCIGSMRCECECGEAVMPPLLPPWDPNL